MKKIIKKLFTPENYLGMSIALGFIALSSGNVILIVLAFFNGFWAYSRVDHDKWDDVDDDEFGNINLFKHGREDRFKNRR